MTDIVAVTPFLADAATAGLADWGPLGEATGEPMQNARRRSSRAAGQAPGRSTRRSARST